MEPVGIVMGICIDLSKKKTKVNMQKIYIFHIDKGTFGIFTGFCHLRTLDTSGRNMAVELDSRHLLLPKTGWENEDLTLILRGKN
jgi:hypothetical protein